MLCFLNEERFRGLFMQLTAYASAERLTTAANETTETRIEPAQGCQMPPPVQTAAVHGTADTPRVSILAEPTGQPKSPLPLPRAKPSSSLPESRLFIFKGN